MSRVTAPVSRLSRTLNSASVANPHHAGAALTPKYAELLRTGALSSTENPDHPRGMVTKHRPTPQPSLSNRSKPLMQTFHSTAVSSAAASIAPSSPSTHLDATVLPSMYSAVAASDAGAGPRMPLLPDNYAGAYSTPESPGAPPAGTISIVAAHPDKVVAASAVTEVEGVSLDGVDLKFAHEHGAARASGSGGGDEHEGGMLRDLWKGMMDDVFGEETQHRRKA